MARAPEDKGKVGFTPGPWQVSEMIIGGRSYGIDGVMTVDPDNLITIYGGGGARSYSRDVVVFRHGRTVDPTFAANARLIAAAPDLFASVQELLGIYWGDGDGQLPEPACIQNARAAINKALGKRPSTEGAQHSQARE